MKCFVTGASGFIGAALTGELLERGHRVKALIEPGANELALKGVKFVRVTGDVLDRKLLEREMDGCEWVFHTADLCRLWMRSPRKMYLANVDGTTNVIEAAGKLGCQKIVYTSTAYCVAPASIKAGRPLPSKEIDVVAEAQMPGHYFRSKFLAEAVAVKAARGKGLPVIVLNPACCVGAGDAEPTMPGRFVLDFLNRRMPVCIERGSSWVHINDVVAGHILAAEKGRFGERYILGNNAANWSFLELLDQLEAATGLKARIPVVPRWMTRWAAEFGEYAAYITGQAPRLTSARVKLSRQNHWVDSSKAVRELGLPQTPVQQGFEAAMKWFRFNGYAKK